MQYLYLHKDRHWKKCPSHQWCETRVKRISCWIATCIWRFLAQIIGHSVVVFRFRTWFHSEQRQFACELNYIKKQALLLTPSILLLKLTQRWNNPWRGHLVDLPDTFEWRCFAFDKLKQLTTLNSSTRSFVTLWNAQVLNILSWMTGQSHNSSFPWLIYQTGSMNPMMVPFNLV